MIKCCDRSLEMHACAGIFGFHDLKVFSSSSGITGSSQFNTRARDFIFCHHHHHHPRPGRAAGSVPCPAPERSCLSALCPD